MTRSLSFVTDDDSKELPVIESVGWTEVKTVTNTVDPFTQKADELKSKVSGLSSVFKRKTTNDIKKYHRGADGTESKKLEDENYFKE